MARLSNEEIRRMSLVEADVYTDLHPAEAWRFAREHGKSAIKQSKKTVKHGVESGLLYMTPDTLETA